VPDVVGASEQESDEAKLKELMNQPDHCQLEFEQRLLR